MSDIDLHGAVAAGGRELDGVHLGRGEDEFHGGSVDELHERFAQRHGNCNVYKFQ